MAVGEVAEAKVRQFSKDKDGAIGLDAGKAMAYHEVANLIVGGDTVYVIVPDGPGSYRYTDKVRVKPEQRQYLESFGGGGAVTAALRCSFRLSVRACSTAVATLDSGTVHGVSVFVTGNCAARRSRPMFSQRRDASSSRRIPLATASLLKSCRFGELDTSCTQQGGALHEQRPSKV